MNRVLSWTRSGVLYTAIGLFSIVGVSSAASAGGETCAATERAAPTVQMSSAGGPLEAVSSQIINVSISGLASRFETWRADGTRDSHRVDSDWGSSTAVVYVGRPGDDYRFEYPYRVTMKDGRVVEGTLTKFATQAELASATPSWATQPTYVPAPPPASTSIYSSAYTTVGQAGSYINSAPATQVQNYAALPTYQSATPTYTDSSYAAAVPWGHSQGGATTYEYGTPALTGVIAQPTAGWQTNQQPTTVWRVRPSAQASVYTSTPAATYGQATQAAAYPRSTAQSSSVVSVATGGTSSSAIDLRGYRRGSILAISSQGLERGKIAYVRTGTDQAVFIEAPGEPGSRHPTQAMGGGVHKLWIGGDGTDYGCYRGNPYQLLLPNGASVPFIKVNGQPHGCRV